MTPGPSAALTPRSGAAIEAARRLWARAGGAAATDAAAPLAAALCAQLTTALGRWIGHVGFVALFDQAIGEAREEHPALELVTAADCNTSCFQAVADAHGAARLAAGMVGLIAALIDVLGRIIGEDIAMRLVEQTGIPSSPRVVSAEMEAGSDAQQA